MSMWLLLKSDCGAAPQNMAVDEALLEFIGRLGSPVLRFYSWNEPAATFGYSQRFTDVARWTQLRPLIRRPTGGGLVPHDADWTYSLVFPTSHPWYAFKAWDSYERVHAWLEAAFRAVGLSARLSPCEHNEGPGQCFIGAEKFDLLWNGRKIAGAAQRRNRLGLLIQGSVQARGLPVTREAWMTAMEQTVPEPEEIRWTDLPAAMPAELSEEFQARIEQLVREKYSQAAYNERR